MGVDILWFREWSVDCRVPYVEFKVKSVRRRMKSVGLREYSVECAVCSV